MKLLSLVLTLFATIRRTCCFSISTKSVSDLLNEHQTDVDRLKAQVPADAAQNFPYTEDAFYLRYCLAHGSPEEQDAAFGKSLDWRLNGAGHSICQAAAIALAEATAAAGTWNNEPVLSKAPHSDKISRYITPNNVITTSSSRDDLVYCIRAGFIDDQNLMKSVSVQEMTDFFLYAKEIHALVTLQRSLQLDRLVSVWTANDLTKVKLIGGSDDFRQALSQSSKQAAELYPSMSGPTLLLNLPKLLNALVKLFTPLFPETVRARLAFVQAPGLAKLESLTDLGDLVATELEPIVYK